MKSATFKIIIPILFIVNAISMHAQISNPKHYFREYCKAKQLYEKGDTLSACKLFTEIFGTTEYGTLRHIYNTLDIAVECGNIPLIKALIKSAIRKGETLDEMKEFIGRSTTNRKYIDAVSREMIVEDSVYYHSGLDSFLIKELIHLGDRDQLFRDEYPHKYPDGYGKFVDSMNYLYLKTLVKIEGGKLPPYRKIGPAGSDALRLILVHMDIEMLAELFPAIVKSINRGEFFDTETVLYQIDRNHVGGDSLYRYDALSGRLKAFAPNKLLHKRLGNYQYYGWMDISDMRTRTINYWPFHPEVNAVIQKEMYDVLGLVKPSENPFHSIFTRRTDQEFIDLLLNIEVE